MSLTGRLDGRVAIVTGGASGIGAGTVRRFVDEGARVVIADILDAQGEKLAADLGDAALYRHVDVTVEDDVAAAVDGAVSAFGRLDVMFNNAGILGAVGSIAKTSMDDVDRTVAVILRGTFVGMKHAARVMIPQGAGVILSTTSPAGLVGGLGAHAYSAVKAALIGLTQSVAAELRPHGIRVNAIAPGAIVTAMTADIITGDPDDLDGAERALAETALLGRAGRADDIAAGAVYLASEDGAFVTGHTLRIDAGLTTIAGPSPFAIGEYEEPGVLLGPTGRA